VFWVLLFGLIAWSFGGTKEPLELWDKKSEKREVEQEVFSSLRES
jgi:hypothetical protein